MIETRVIDGLIWTRNTNHPIRMRRDHWWRWDGIKEIRWEPGTQVKICQYCGNEYTGPADKWCSPKCYKNAKISRSKKIR